jgi:hypothetical protein
VNGFVKDVLEGLTSEFFMSEQNVDLDDERSFDPDVADFLKKQMREKGCSFDEARLELIRCVSLFAFVTKTLTCHHVTQQKRGFSDPLPSPYFM